MSHIPGLKNGSPTKPLTRMRKPGIGRIVGEYNDDNRLLSEFVGEVWRSDYAAKVTFPHWTPSYFDWQFPSDSPINRRLCVRDSQQLLAVLMGTPSRFRYNSNVLHGAHYSWLSVRQQHRGLGLAKQLDAARMSLERTSQSDLIVSYRYTGSKYSLAERPTRKSPKFQRPIGLWARPLCGTRLRRWNTNRAEGWLAWIGTPLTSQIDFSDSTDCLRPFDPIDLGQCLNLVTSRNEQFALTVDWDESLLQHQLNGSHMSHTLVWERGYTVRGFVNYHILNFQGRTVEPVAIIDMLEIDDLTYAEQSEFLRRCLGQMKQQGAIVALKLRSGDVSARTMMASGFTPRIRDSHLVLQTTAAPMKISRKSRLRLLWR